MAISLSQTQAYFLGSTQVEASPANFYDATIYANGDNMITIQGGVDGLSTGIYSAGTGSSSIFIGSTGTVSAYFTAVGLAAGGDAIVNHGSLFGRVQGIGSETAVSFASLDNRGSIIAGNGSLGSIVNAAISTGSANGENVQIRNSGLIQAQVSVGFSLALDGNSNDTIINTGEIIGNARLGAGADVFDSRKGVFEGVLDAGAGADKLYGTTEVDRFNGGDDNDVIYGYLGDDQLSGGIGNDTLIGGVGADYLNGGSGTDAASYNSATSAVFVNLTNPASNTGEAAGDRFVSIENLSGSNYNDQLLGNSVANLINGGAGNDIIRGYAGNDTFIGGAGNDTFVFNTALNAVSNVDTITDFSVPADTMQLDNLVFTSLANGVFASAAFRANTSGLAQDTSDRIIYESDTGELYYDANGSAAGGGILFAKVGTGLALTAADFFVI